MTSRAHLSHNVAVAASESPGSYTRIYAVIRRIPRGRVATYGQVARLAGLPGHARQVGYALHAMANAGPVPWHRVINARGEVSPRKAPGADTLQRDLLRSERVSFDRGGRIDLARYGWRPRGGAGTPAP